MKLKVLCITLLLCFPHLSFAAKLVIPSSFEFMAIDGKDMKSFWDGPYEVDLNVGMHKIALQYDAAVPSEENPRMEEFLKSEPMLITLDVQRNETYTLVPHPDIKSDPRGYASNPRIKIVTPEGRKAKYEVALLVERQQSTWSKVTQSDGSIAEPKSEMAVITGNQTVPTSKTAASSAPVNGAAPAAAMLQYWWGQADAQTRENFMKWVYSQ